MKCEKTSKIISCLSNFCEKKNAFLAKFISPIMLLTIRIMVAMVFLKSGLTKIANFDATIFLFENEYHVPLLNPVFAAYLATITELLCSGLLIAGLAARLAATVLFIMTLVIQFLVIQNPEHYNWLAFLAVIFTFGPGCISLDALVKRCALKCNK